MWGKNISGDYTLLRDQTWAMTGSTSYTRPKIQILVKPESWFQETTPWESPHWCQTWDNWDSNAGFQNRMSARIGLSQSLSTSCTKNHLYKSSCDSELGALIKIPLRWMRWEPWFELAIKPLYAFALLWTSNSLRFGDSDFGHNTHKT